MINQQLLDFIKLRLLKGADREIIKNELLGSGWQMEDIEEGFSAINASVANPEINQTNSSVFSSGDINNPTIAQNPTSTGRRVMLFILVILFILVGGVSGYYFRNDIPIIKDLIKNKEITPISEINQEEDNQNQIQPSEIINTIEKSNFINCGTESSCFIEASKNCSPAFVEETMEMDLFGMIQKNKIKYTIYGLNSLNKCDYSSYLIDANVSFSDEIKQQAKITGITDEELKLQLEESNATLKSTIGMLTKCSFETSYLTKLLIKWDNGDFSSSDLDPGNCNITGGELLSTDTTIYISSKVRTLSIEGFKFEYISISNNNAKIIVTEKNTNKTQTVDFVLNKDMTIFGKKMTLIEVKEEENTANSNEGFKSLIAGIRIRNN